MFLFVSCNFINFNIRYNTKRGLFWIWMNLHSILAQSWALQCQLNRIRYAWERMGSVWIAHCRSIHFDLAAKPRRHWQIRCHALFVVVDINVKMQLMVQWTLLDHIQPDEDWWAAIDWSGSKESIVFHLKCMRTKYIFVCVLTSCCKNSPILVCTQQLVRSFGSYRRYVWSLAIRPAARILKRLPIAIRTQKNMQQHECSD